MSTPSSSLGALAGQHVLVTGGTGYIGSHTVLALQAAGARVTIVDNLANSSPLVLDRMHEIRGGGDAVRPQFYEADLRDWAKMEQIFKDNKFDACVHFAGLKAVGESVSKPLMYYDCNLVGTLNLLRLLDAHECRRLVFSSSATVYGMAEVNPIPETAPLATTNPYGATKLMIENMLRDIAAAPVASADKSWRIVILRYFNPIGAHPSGRIGEDPLGIPNNLLPFVMQVACGRRAELSVFGDDYPTRDGTGVRDYIHVEDLADGHVAAIQHGIFGDALCGKSCDAFNLGTGNGVSVLEMVEAARKASGKPVPFKVSARRPGDVATCFADASKAKALLHWNATRTVEEAVADSWRWQEKNPMGFATGSK